MTLDTLLISWYVAYVSQVRTYQLEQMTALHSIMMDVWVLPIYKNYASTNIANVCNPWLTPPQNFAAYRQAELDNNRISTFTSMAAVPYISNRFALQRFLGLSEEEIAENERLWQEENDENLTDLITDDMAGEMRGAGLSGADLAGDLGGLEDELGGDAGGVDGGTGDAPETNTEAELGGAEADTAQTI
jgi:hypothetical protein